MTAENSSILHKPPCILDSQLLAGKVGTNARDSSPLRTSLNKNRRNISLEWKGGELLFSQTFRICFGVGTTENKIYAILANNPRSEETIWFVFSRAWKWG